MVWNRLGSCQFTCSWTNYPRIGELCWHFKMLNFSQKFNFPNKVWLSECRWSSQFFLVKEMFGEVWLREEYFEEMILTLAEQSQQLSHTCTWKISRVFQRIHTNDLCNAGAVLLPIELWSHSDVTWLINFVGLMCPHERNKLWVKGTFCEVWLRDELKKWFLKLASQFFRCT